MAVAALALMATVAAGIHAASFAVRSLGGEAPISLPVVNFTDPQTPGVAVLLSDHGTRATVNVSVPATGIALQRRNAVFYDDFNSSPEGRVTYLTCSDKWSWSSNEGALELPGDSRGEAGSYGRECIVVANVDVSQYAQGGHRIYVAFLAWRSGFSQAWENISFDSVYVKTSGSTKMYTAGFKVEVLPGGTGDYLISRLRYWSERPIQRNRHWKTLARASLGVGYTLEYDYLSYVVSWIDFSSWHITHWNGSALTSAQIRNRYRFTPSYVGIGYKYRPAYSGETIEGTVWFDNLVITVDAKPWLVNVTNVPPGWSVRLLNATGGLVAEASAGADGVASLNITPLRLNLTQHPGYRDGFIIPNATIEVYDSRGNLVASSSFDEVVGGDVYVLRGFRGRILQVDSSLAGVSFESRLVVSGVSCGDSYIWIYLANTTGAYSSPIIILHGSLVAGETSQLAMTPGADGVAGYIYAVAYAPAGSTCTLDLSYQYTFSGWRTYGVDEAMASFTGG